jgi:hypothetical protein
MKSLRKVFLVPVFLIGNIFFSSMLGQKDVLEQKTTLFEYGTVTASEDNLENLFRNFPVFIDNGKDIDFLSYKFVGVIKNKRTAKKYVRKNFKDLVPLGWSMMIPSAQNEGDKSSISYHIDFVRESKSELKAMIDTISRDHVNIGDEVYVIEFVENLQKHEHYVFINPNTKNILLKGNIFGVEIPRAHVAYIEKTKGKKQE